MEKYFALTKPCGNCPFRNDGQSIELRDGRREQIIEGLLKGEDTGFQCHKTAHKQDMGEVQQCPGAAAVARKFGRDTVMVQVATRMGIIDAGHLDDAMASTIEPEDLNIDCDKMHIGV